MSADLLLVQHVCLGMESKSIYLCAQRLEGISFGLVDRGLTFDNGSS
jgi:hypothetical protein